MREELKSKNFEVITVACETKGAVTAMPFVEAAKQTHPSLLDQTHVLPELYNTRNVPAAFWIDEQMRIVRANDPIYAQRRTYENGQVTSVTTNEKYLNAVRDWVEKGPQSIYVQGSKALEKTGKPEWADVQAMAHFRLGVHLHQGGHPKEAIVQFKQAHALRPGNWNYRRQAYNLGNIKDDYGYENFQAAMKEPTGLPFYPPLELPDLPPA